MTNALTVTRTIGILLFDVMEEMDAVGPCGDVREAIT